jgi:hypothetical protein
MADMFTFKELIATPGPEGETEDEAYLRYRAMKRRKHMYESTEEEVDEALNTTQRLAKSRQMKRYASRIAVGRRKAMKRTADPARIKRRAQKSARMALFKKLSKGLSPSDVPYARRAELEKKLDKMKGRIDRMAKKMIPKVRQKERDRKRAK